ncbi:ribosomal protein S18-alanine N-acetyltransferase [Consotaella aegiceratis]|uniref:ribosomal protein S18-alanine N-acetyltransferase n=1 Tax=Consotaella aegiceratis TaxID=3097961 RepID=UPI002F3EB632
MYWYWPWVWTVSLWGSMVSSADIIVTEVERGDVEAAAELHSRAFDHAWSADELTALLAHRGTFGFVARKIGQPATSAVGFVLVRAAADEAEILTIAVDRAARRQGIGRLLMDNALQRLYAERVRRLFLEVDEGNQSARALYRRLRFEEAGRRPAYYLDAAGHRSNALVLRRDLR